MENKYKMITTKLPNGGELHDYSNGIKHWLLNGKHHREDGPAIEWGDGEESWYLHGEYIPCTTQKQFEQLMRLKAFW
jgi:hypothetical protein